MLGDQVAQEEELTEGDRVSAARRRLGLDEHHDAGQEAPDCVAPTTLRQGEPAHLTYATTARGTEPGRPQYPA